MNFKAPNPKDLEPKARQASDLLKTLSNPNRLLILCHLRKGEMSVGGLEQVIGLGQSALSQHLARLRRDGLVKTRRQAQAIFYRIEGDAASRVIDTLYELYCGRPGTEDQERSAQNPKEE